MSLKQFSDLGLVTALITKGYSPHGRHKEGRKVLFTFEYDEEVEQLERDFFNNRLDVDARKFHMTMKSVKNSIYQMED